MASRKLNQPLVTIFSTLTITLSLACSSSFATTESEPPLTSVAAARTMSRAEMAEETPVRIRGTVTFFSDQWNILFVYQDGQSIKVGAEFDTQVAVGSRVEIEGRVLPGDVGPVIVATRVESLASDKAPIDLKTAAFKIDSTTPFSVSLVDQWVEFEGPAYSAVADDQRYYVNLAGEQFGVHTMIPSSANFPPLETLRKLKMRVRGIPSISVQPGAEGQIDLLVPDSTFVEFLPNDAASTSTKLRKIGAIGRVDMQGDVETPARIRAVVRDVTDYRRLFVADETGSLLVETGRDVGIGSLSPGDVVEVEGRIVRIEKQQYITEAFVRFIGKGFSLAPVLTPATEALNHLAELIEIDGTLVARDDQKHWLLMKSGTNSFRVRISETTIDELSRWGIGSRFRLTGCPSISENLDADFELFSNRVSVIFGLPVETPSAPTSAADAAFAQASAPAIIQPAPVLSWATIRLALQVTLATLAGLIAWLLYRRLKKQEKFHESIHEQLSNLSHIARLNTLSEMVGALAHELNQPLASVSNYAAAAELLSKKEPADSEKLGSVLTNIGQEAFRAGEIIRRLRHLVRRKTPGSLPIDISEVIDETVELFKTQHITANGLVQTDVPDNLPTVQADSVQIQQVILNLLLNARDATEDQSERSPAIHIAAEIENGMVRVTVCDNGIGINNSNPDAIFEPYFTTRAKGTGLGLAISRTIIETHGGKIAAEHDSPYGTRITFTLPVALVRAHVAG